MRCCCLFDKDDNNLNLNNLTKPFFSFSVIKKEFNENKEISKFSTKKTFPFKLTKIKDKNSTYKSIREIHKKPHLSINSSNISKNRLEINHSIVENLKFSYYDDNNEEEILDKFSDNNIPKIQKNKNIITTNINTISSKMTEQTSKPIKNTEENNKNIDSSSVDSEQENESIVSLTDNNKKINLNNNNNNNNNNDINNLSNNNSEKLNHNNNNNNNNHNSNINNSTKKIIQFKKNNSQIFEEPNSNNKKFSFGNIKKFNPFINRRSSVMNYGKPEPNHKNSLKRNSIMQLYEKQSGLNEFKMIESLSKNHYFISRLKLIQNTYLKNKRINLIESCHLNNEGKGKINLHLENVVGKLLLENLIITPLGLLENSRRNQKDTLTFFGYSDQKNYNDYILNNTSFIYNNKTFSKTLFAFSYDINNEKYFIQPILDKEKQGRLIYIGIPNFVYNFINKKFFLLNKNLIQIIPSSNNNSNNKTFSLQIRVYENNTGKCNEFNVNNISKDKTISIGYSTNNYISLKGDGGPDDECILNFDKEKEIWSNKGKKLWSVLDQKISINNYIYIKIGEDIIKVSLLVE